MARSIGFCVSRDSSLARLIGFCSPKNSSLVRSNGFRPSMNSFIATSSMTLCHSRPIGGNCYSLPMLMYLTYSSSSVPTATTTETGRRAVQLPWLMLAPPESTSVYKFHRPSKKDVKVVAVESSQDPSDSDSELLGSPFQGWMAYIRRKDCQFFLFNPLSGRKIILPSVETLPYLKGVIRNSLSGLVESFIPYDSGKPLSPQEVSKLVINDVVLSSSPMDDDCIAVITYGCPAKLAFCRIRHGHPNCWILLDSPFRQCFQIVYHSGKKLFYTLSYVSHELEAWDLHSDPIKRFHFHEDQTQVLGTITFPKNVCGVKMSIPQNNWANEFYLVYDHESQELFFVTRFVLSGLDVDHVHDVPHIGNPDLLPYKTLGFDVFKFDFINDDLVKLQYLEDNIGNRAIFLDKRRGFALSTTKFPELKPGCIYFADNSYEWKYNFGGHDMGVYDYREDSIMDEIPFPSHTWFMPDVDVDF